MGGPYKVVVDCPACPTCGEGKLWTVRDPDGDDIGQSFKVWVDAAEVAAGLNKAFRSGALSVTKNRKKRAGVG